MIYPVEDMIFKDTDGDYCLITYVCDGDVEFIYSSDLNRIIEAKNDNTIWDDFDEDRYGEDYCESHLNDGSWKVIEAGTDRKKVSKWREEICPTQN